MQDSSGSFGGWGPSNADLWLTAYVTDFLTRAKENGSSVPPEGFGRALDRLQNFLSYAQDFEKGGEDRAYAIYVLARNARAPIGELRYYADERLDRFSTPLAKAQVGAALAMMGDKERAESAFAAALSGMSAEADTRATAATTARRCATARRSSPSPPRRASRKRKRRSSRALSPKPTRRAATRPRRNRRGCCLRRRRSATSRRRRPVDQWREGRRPHAALARSGRPEGRRADHRE